MDIWYSDPTKTFRAVRFDSLEALPREVRSWVMFDKEDHSLCPICGEPLCKHIYYGNRYICRGTWLVLSKDGLATLTDESFHHIFCDLKTYDSQFRRKLAMSDPLAIIEALGDEVSQIYQRGLLEIEEDSKYTARDYRTASGKLFRAIKFRNLAELPPEFICFSSMPSTNTWGAICKNCGNKVKDHVRFNKETACKGDYLVLTSEMGEPYMPYTIFTEKQFEDLFCLA